MSATIMDNDHSTKHATKTEIPTNDIGEQSTNNQQAVASVMFYGTRKRRPEPSAPCSPPFSVGKKSRKWHALSHFQ